MFKPTNIFVSVSVLIILTFAAALLLLSEWHFQEHRLPVYASKGLSIIAFIGLTFFYRNLTLFMFKYNNITDLFSRIVFVLYYIGQSFFAIIFCCALAMVTFNLW